MADPALWGEVLQLPNLRNDAGLAERARQAWLTRQGEMSVAQQGGMSAYEEALQAQREKAMADLVAADAARAAGRGGGGGGGGGKKGGKAPAAMATIPQDNYQPWIDQYAFPNSPPPTYDGTLMPSTKYGANNVYKNTLPKPSKAPMLGTTSRAYSRKPNRSGGPLVGRL